MQALAPIYARASIMRGGGNGYCDSTILYNANTDAFRIVATLAESILTRSVSSTTVLICEYANTLSCLSTEGSL